MGRAPPVYSTLKVRELILQLPAGAEKVGMVESLNLQRGARCLEKNGDLITVRCHQAAKKLGLGRQGNQSWQVGRHASNKQGRLAYRVAFIGGEQTASQIE